VVTHFIEKYNCELNKDCPGMSAQAMRTVMAYSWPRNIRELSNVIERAMIFSEDKPIEEEDLAFTRTQNNDSKMWQRDLKLAMRAFEKQYIMQVLRDNNFDKRLASRLLGVGLSSLYRKMVQLRISVGNGQCEPVDQTSEAQGKLAKCVDRHDMLKADPS
jgi:DNA-binding NtrC family response regulator